MADCRVPAKGKSPANGTVNEPIIFQGDRLEAVYDDLPNQSTRLD